MTGPQVVGTVPVVSDMISTPSGYGAATVLVDFHSGDWAPFTVTVGPSGALSLEFLFRGYNSNTGVSVLWLSARLSGTAAVAGTVGDMRAARVQSVGAGVQSALTGVGRRIMTGLAAGAYTVTPQFQYSAGTVGTDVVFTDGRIIATPLTALGG